MRARVMEDRPDRLRDLAHSWGVSVVAGQSAAVTHAAIEAEARRAMRRVREAEGGL